MKKTIMLTAASACLLAALPAQANLVLDGGFEIPVVSGDFQTFNATTAMGAWTVSAGSVDLIGTYWVSAGGAQSVDMAGYFQNGTISQTIATTPSAWYYLTFDMAGNPGGLPTSKKLEVTFGNTTLPYTFDTTGHNLGSMGWTGQSGWFQAGLGGSTVLSFKDTSDPLPNGSPTAWGAALDNVSLVPEPTTMIAGALLLLPFGMSTIRILRKNRTA